jgi:putative transposase
LDDIRKSTNKGLALGNDRFKVDIEAMTGKRMAMGQRGRPMEWQKDKGESV